MVCVRDGRIVADGPPAEVLADRRHVAEPTPEIP
jgi:hypothetical protein